MVKDLRQRSGLAWFCTRAESCLVFNTESYTVLPDNSILITANMQSETGFPSSRQLKSYVVSESRLKLAARCPVGGCWPSGFFGKIIILWTVSTEHCVCSNRWFWRTQILWHQRWSGHSIIYGLTSVMALFLFTSLELTYLNILTTKSWWHIQTSSLRWNGWKWHLENSVTDWRFHSVNVGGKCYMISSIGFFCSDNYGHPM